MRILEYIHDESFRGNTVNINDIMSYIGIGRTQAYEIIKSLKDLGIIENEKGEYYFDPEYINCLMKYEKEIEIPFEKRINTKIRRSLDYYINTYLNEIEFKDIEGILSEKIKKILTKTKSYRINYLEFNDEIRNESPKSINEAIKGLKIESNNSYCKIVDDIFIGDSLIYSNLIYPSEDLFRKKGRHFKNFGVARIGTYKIYHSNFFGTIIPIILMPICYDIKTQFMYPQFRFFNPKNLPFRELFSEFPDLQDNLSIHYTLEILKDASMYKNIVKMLNRLPETKLIMINGSIFNSYSILGKKLKNRSYKILYDEYTQAFKGFLSKIVEKKIIVLGVHISNNTTFIYQIFKNYFDLKAGIMPTLWIYERILRPGQCSCLLKRPDKKYPYSKESKYFENHFYEFYLANRIENNITHYEMFIPYGIEKEDLLELYKEIVNFLYYNSVPRLSIRGAVIKSYQKNNLGYNDIILNSFEGIINNNNKYFFSPIPVSKAVYYGLLYVKKLEIFFHQLFRNKAYELYKEIEESFIEDIEKREN
ncbi:MAG: hypothetical protein ACTSRP_19840 [Candidatus Helarchaeota archaeon]